MPSKFFFVSVFLFCIASVKAQSENDKIDTDRPDQTESVNVIPKGWMQFESGFNYQKNKPFNKEYFLPTLLSKYGLSRRIELRLITTVRKETVLAVPAGTTSQTNLEQVEVGAKIALFDQRKLLPKTSFIFHFGVPGLASYPTNGFLFNSRLTMQHTISNNISLGYNFGMEQEGKNDPKLIYTIAPGFNIGNKWYAYIEAFGTIFNHPEHSIDGGVAYFISNNTKIDLSSGFGISGDAPEWYISLGFSARFILKRN